MENIHVILRVRPLNSKELTNKEDVIWSLNTQTNTMECKVKDLPPKVSSFAKSTFSFDSHYSPYSLNHEIYQKSVKPFILTSLEGINATIFMYGQTGSGKTYTILGEKEFLKEDTQRILASATNKKEMGILLLSIGEMFDRIKKDQEKTYMVKCSYIEIYNDTVFDLLKPFNGHRPENITINEDQNKEFFLKGVTEQCINNCDEILEMLKQGEINRHYAETNMNHVSSRSHTLFRIAITAFTNSSIRSLRKEALNRKFNLDDNLNVINSDLLDSETIVTESYINFVDLAGSEKLNIASNSLEDEENRGPTSFSSSNCFDSFGNNNNSSPFQREKSRDRVREGQFINKSLFFLTQVIALKSEGKSNLHIPYRNSPLTKILKSSLGGNSRTMIILCVNPTLSNLENSLTSLRFGANAKKIQNKIETNIVTKSEEEAFKRMVKEYEKKLTDLELTKNAFKAKYECLFLDYKELLDKTLRSRLSPKAGNFNKAGMSTSDSNPVSYYFESAGEVFVHNKNMTCFNLQCQVKGLKANFQELLFDNVGKYACFAYKKIKEKSRTLQDKVKFLEESLKSLSEHHLKTYADGFKYNSKWKKYKEKFKTIKRNYKYLTDVDLTQLSQTYTQELDLIKDEQIHRLYRKEIHQLRTQLNIDNSPHKKEPKGKTKNNKEEIPNVEEEKIKIQELLQANQKNNFLQGISSFDFEDFETHFLNNPLDLSFIFDKKTGQDQQKSPLPKSPVFSTVSLPMKSMEKIEKPLEKIEKGDQTSKDKPQESTRKHKKTTSLAPLPKTKPLSKNKSEKRPQSVEKPQTLIIEQSQEFAKLKDLIEDKKILTETFVLNRPKRPREDSLERAEKRSRASFKEDAENLKILVRQVSHTIHENMEGIQGKMSKCQIADFFSEQDFFSNTEEFNNLHNLNGTSAEKMNNLENSNIQVSFLNMTEDFEGRGKKRRTRAERNGPKKMD